MNWFKFGACIWIASSLGWFGIALVLDMPEALGASLGCLLMAAIWNGMGNGHG